MLGLRPEMRCDATSVESVRQMFDQTVMLWYLDIPVNNAPMPNQPGG